jgi:hypothetical protein
MDFQVKINFGFCDSVEVNTTDLWKILALCSFIEHVEDIDGEDFEDDEFDDEEYEFDDDGYAYWFDEENEVWYWYDEESDDWYECEDEIADECEDEIADDESAE